MTTPYEQHEHRITALERADEQTQKRLDALERNHDDLKVTIMEEIRDTRRSLQATVEQLISMTSDDRSREDNIRLARNNNVKDIMLAIFGAGGIITLLFEWLK